MNSFTDEELAALEKNYRFTLRTNPSPLSIQAKKLLDDQQLAAYLLQVKKQTNAANLAVAASLLSKRYSFAVLIALYSMSAFNKRLDFSLDNVCIETLDEADTLWLPAFKFHNLSSSEADHSSRSEWRKAVVEQVFRDHVDVLFPRLTRHSKLSKLIMWENLYTYICWMYRSLLENPQWSDRHGAIAEDFRYIVSEGKGELFGTFHKNPFVRYSPSPSSEQTGQKRQTCCLSYLAGAKGTRCTICPIACIPKQT